MQFRSETAVCDLWPVLVSWYDICSKTLTGFLNMSVSFRNWRYIVAGLNKTRGQVARTTNFCTVAHSICGSSVWNLLQVTFLAPRILRWLIDFLKIFTPHICCNWAGQSVCREQGLIQNAALRDCLTSETMVYYDHTCTFCINRFYNAKNEYVNLSDYAWQL